MATGFENFDRDLQIALTDMEPEAMRRELAAFAKASLAEVIASGAGSPDYQRFVNGRQGVPEEAVELPGPIVYVFTNWRLAIETALAELGKRVPRRSGRYASSFLVVVDGRPVTDFATVAPDAEVVILNFQPYTRKMESGANGPGRRHFDLSKGAFNRRFKGAFVADVQYMKVTGGLHPGMPYILKRSQGRRKDRQAGMPITYPALIMRAV